MNWLFNSRYSVIAYLLFVITFLFLLSCKDEKDKRIGEFIDNIEATDINSYRNIQFMIFGEKEIYSYSLADTLFTEWKYNQKTNLFEDLDSVKMRTFTNSPLSFAQSLRKKIQTIKVVSITQSIAGAKQFWIADNEYVTYVYAGSDDSKSNELLDADLKTSEKIRENWHFCRLKVCRNR